MCGHLKQSLFGCVCFATWQSDISARAHSHTFNRSRTIHAKHKIFIAFNIRDENNKIHLCAISTAAAATTTATTILYSQNVNMLTAHTQRAVVFVISFDRFALLLDFFLSRRVPFFSFSTALLYSMCFMNILISIDELSAHKMCDCIWVFVYIPHICECICNIFALILREKKTTF